MKLISRCGQEHNSYAYKHTDTILFPPALPKNIRKKKNHRHPKTAYSVKCAAFLMGNSSFFARRAMFSSLRCPKVSLSNTCTVFKAMLPLKEPEVSPFWAENENIMLYHRKSRIRIITAFPNLLYFFIYCPSSTV